MILLLISSHLIHSGAEENEIKGKRNVIRRIHDAEGDWAKRKHDVKKENYIFISCKLQIIFSNHNIYKDHNDVTDVTDWTGADGRIYPGSCWTV